MWDGQESADRRLPMVCIREEEEIKDDPKVFYLMMEGVGEIK